MKREEGQRRQGTDSTTPFSLTLVGLSGLRRDGKWHRERRGPTALRDRRGSVRAGGLGLWLGWKGRTRRWQGATRREHVFRVEAKMRRAREDRVRATGPPSSAPAPAACARGPRQAVADAADESGYPRAEAAVAGGRAQARRGGRGGERERGRGRVRVGQEAGRVDRGEHGKRAFWILGLALAGRLLGRLGRRR